MSALRKLTTLPGAPGTLHSLINNPIQILTTTLNHPVVVSSWPLPRRLWRPVLSASHRRAEPPVRPPCPSNRQTTLYGAAARGPLRYASRPPSFNYSGIFLFRRIMETRVDTRPVWQIIQRRCRIISSARSIRTLIKRCCRRLTAATHPPLMRSRLVARPARQSPGRLRLRPRRGRCSLPGG
jgi:hypothetical protein